jgi:hypothetical protein
MNVYPKTGVETNVGFAVKNASDPQIQSLSNFVKSFAEAGSITYSYHMGVARFGAMISSPDARESFNLALTEKELAGEIGQLLSVRLG